MTIGNEVYPELLLVSQIKKTKLIFTEASARRCSLKRDSNTGGVPVNIAKFL